MLFSMQDINASSDRYVFLSIQIKTISNLTQIQWYLHIYIPIGRFTKQ